MRFLMRRGPAHQSGGGGLTELKHLRFGRTNFGTTPTGTDLTWGWGSPLHRFTYTMGGGTTSVHGVNANCIVTPYGLHHFTEATGQEPTDNNTVSWGTLAQTYATANSLDVELFFLHAAVGQHTNSAVVASVSPAGLVTLGLNTSNNKQQMSQARAGVAASNAYQPGTQYTLTTASPVQTVTVTVQSIPSTTTIQTDYTGVSATGGSIYRLGDGTITLANRIFFESETDWAWATNFGNTSARAFQAYRVGQIISDGSNGVFWDSHYAGNMHWQSQEYGTTSGLQAYVNDLCTAFALYRSTYPGTLYFPNIAAFTTTQDAQMADAAGATQQEGGINLFNTLSFSTGGPVDFAIARLGAGTISEISTHPDFNATTPHAGIQGAPTGYTSTGGNHFTTAADRAIMAEYAAAFTIVNQGQPKKLYFDPANDNWAVFPLSARWETGFEYPLGEPVDSLTPQKSVYASGTDASGKSAKVFARLFSTDGTQATAFTALVLFRVYQGNTAAYDASTAYTVNIVYPPPSGMAWGVLDDTGAITGNIRLGDSVQLWNPDALFLVPTAVTTGAIWYASPTGLSANAGTQAAPWDIVTALAGGPAGTSVLPGDTIRVRAGTYGTGAETYTISLTGTAAKPITITNMPGENVALNVVQVDFRGAFTVIQPQAGSCGLEIYRSTGPTSQFENTDLVRMQDGGDGNKMIHVAIHDGCGDGVSPQSETADHEVYGNYLWNNGRVADINGVYAHGIYSHGTTTAGTTRKIRNNILFDQAAYGIHCFADTGNLQNLDVEQNIAFMNGLGGGGFDLLIGGQTALSALQFLDNVGLRTDGNTVLSLGYLSDSDPGVSNTSGTATGNYLNGGISINNWDAATLTWSSNTAVGASDEIIKWRFKGATATFGGVTATGNAYAQAGNPFGLWAVTTSLDVTVVEYATLADYQTGTGKESASTYTAASNLGTKTFLFPSVFDATRGHLAIDNPTSAATVSVDISSVVQSGHTYAIYNAYDLPVATNLAAAKGTPVLSGTYAGGTVAVPMSGSGKSPPAVVGGGLTATNALPKVGAFLVVQTS